LTLTLSLLVVSALPALAAVAWPGGVEAADAPEIRHELVFPMRREHNHAPGLVECPNGDLVASWYRGSGERSSDDVAVYGARLRKGESQWSDAFLMVDTPGFPDCNTCMMVDADGRLWLFWPVVIANSWESCLTNYLWSNDYSGDGCPKWNERGAIYLKPDDFKEDLLRHMKEVRPQLVERLSKLPAGRRELAEARLKAVEAENTARAGQKLYQRMGWQPRCKPTVLPPSDRLPQGRILLPLYTDTFSIGLMAISDDKGKSWFASKPLMGVGAIQPTVLPRSDGTLVAYMRENGWTGHIRVSESSDSGLTWGPVGVTDLPNPGAGIDGVRLANGHWVLIYNDTTRGRNSLVVSLSTDEGKSWSRTRHLEKHDSGAYHYPCIIQGRDGTIHAIYSYFSPKASRGSEGKSMKHVAFNEAWIEAGDP
jgi:predicted neuraminidase